MLQKQPKVLPLKAAYQFAEEQGLEREAAAIRDLRIEWDTEYKSSLRRGLIVELFEHHSILPLFKEKHWRNGDTPEGQSLRRRYLRLVREYRDFLARTESGSKDTGQDLGRGNPSQVMSVAEGCCGELFEGFTFQNLQSAEPPDHKGVYVVRVKKRGESVEKVVGEVGEVVRKLKWPSVERKMLERIRRIDRIGSCSVIYIGSAGARPSSEYTLSGRYRDFGGRHTAMYPIWALIYYGWELEYGWREDELPADLEGDLKESYRMSHGGRLPALVSR